jgi:dethiobiotin synthetase
MRLIVAGIGTDVGKSVVAAILAQLLEADYWKPVGTGPYERRDSATVANWIDGQCHAESYHLPDPLSPHEAAKRAGIEILADAIRLPKVDRLVIEMVGGLLVPLNDRLLSVDLFDRFEADWVVVSRHYLGSINHTLLTVEALRRRSIEPLGIIFNGESWAATEEAICSQTALPVVGRVGWEAEIDRQVVYKYCNGWRELSPWKSML